MGFFSFFRDEAPPLVEQAFNDVKEMLRHGQVMFEAATAHLLENEILEVDLKEIDKEINQREQDLRRSVLEHLTIDPERELIFSLKLLSIVHEAERVGDLAKSIAKTADLATKPRMSDAAEPLRDFRDRIMQMFERAQMGFVDVDERAARAMMGNHERLKKDVTAYLQALAAREDLSPNEAIVYAMSARMMSRVSSHLANIASTVVCPFDQIRRAPSWPEEQEAAS